MGGSGGGIVDNIIGNKAAQNARQTQLDAGNRDLDQNSKTLNWQESMYSPYVNKGGQAFDQLGQLANDPNYWKGYGGQAPDNNSGVWGSMGGYNGGSTQRSYDGQYAGGPMTGALPTSNYQMQNYTPYTDAKNGDTGNANFLDKMGQSPSPQSQSAQGNPPPQSYFLDKKLWESPPPQSQSAQGNPPPQSYFLDNMGQSSSPQSQSAQGNPSPRSQLAQGDPPASMRSDSITKPQSKDIWSVETGSVPTPPPTGGMDPSHAASQPQSGGYMGMPTVQGSAQTYGVTPSATQAPTTVLSDNGAWGSGSASNYGDHTTSGGGDPGYLAFVQKEGANAVGQNFAAKGAGVSGAQLKGAVDYSQMSANKYLNDAVSRSAMRNNIELGNQGMRLNAENQAFGQGLSSGNQSFNQQLASQGFGREGLNTDRGWQMQNMQFGQNSLNADRGYDLQNRQFNQGVYNSNRDYYDKQQQERLGILSGLASSGYDATGRLTQYGQLASNNAIDIYNMQANAQSAEDQAKGNNFLSNIGRIAGGGWW